MADEEAPETMELPPSYEQAMGHRRVESGYVIPEYSLDGGAYPEPPRSQPAISRPRRPPQSGNTPRTYRLPNTDLSGTATPVVVREDDSISNTSTITDEQAQTCLKLALPSMHMCMAVTCLVLNIILPGTGTIMAGWGIFCCTKKDKWAVKEKFLGCGLNFILGILQLVLVPVLLLGWIWSVIWGFALLGVSLDDYHGMKDETDEDGSPDRPHTSIFRRIPHPSVTRQAMRRSTSRVSVTTSTGTDQSSVRTNPRTPGRATDVEADSAAVHAPNRQVTVPGSRQSDNAPQQSTSGSGQSSESQQNSGPEFENSSRTRSSHNNNSVRSETERHPSEPEDSSENSHKTIDVRESLDPVPSTSTT